MNYYEMTDEQLAEFSREVAEQQTIAAVLNNGTIFTNHPSHNFTGIDGRCYDCDCRPFGRHAPNPCL